MDRAVIETRLANMRLRLNEPGVTAISWMGVSVSWERLAKRDGGIEKRSGSYGKYIYEYRGEELSLEEAINEIMKPVPLRRALEEAEEVIRHKRERIAIQLELERLVWRVLNNERRDWDGCLDQYAPWISEVTEKLIRQK